VFYGQDCLKFGGSRARVLKLLQFNLVVAFPQIFSTPYLRYYIGSEKAAKSALSKPILQIPLAYTYVKPIINK